MFYVFAALFCAWVVVVILDMLFGTAGSPGARPCASRTTCPCRLGRRK